MQPLAHIVTIPHSNTHAMVVNFDTGAASLHRVGYKAPHALTGTPPRKHFSRSQRKGKTGLRP